MGTNSRRNKEIVIEKDSISDTFPVEIKIGYETFFLVKSGDDYKLLSAICPHAGGQVIEENGEFFCPVHMWVFNEEGDCTNAPGEGLACYSVSEKEGKLIAHIK